MQATRTHNKNTSTGSPVAERVLDVLTCFLQSSETEHGISDIARRLQLHKSGVQRFVGALSKKGFVHQNPVSRRYSLWLHSVQLVTRSPMLTTLTALSESVLEDLRDSTGETSSVDVRCGAFRAVIAQCESKHEIRQRKPMHEPMPLHQGAAGKVLLSALAEPRARELAELIRSALDPDLDIDDLLLRVDGARQLGYYVSSNERVQGSCSISAPLPGVSGVNAAVVVVGPDGRFTREQAEASREVVLEATARLSRLVRGIERPASGPEPLRADSTSLSELADPPVPPTPAPR